VGKLERRRRIAVIAALCASLCAGRAGAAVVTHSGPLTSDATWSAADVHRVTGTVTVNAGVTLSIEAGAVVKLNSSTSLVINGALVAVGTPAARIVLTSYRDDSVAGDTNGDGPSVPKAGDWAGLQFNSTTSVAATHVENVDLRYGGSATGALLVSSADVTLQSLHVSDSASAGIHVTQASPQILGCEVERSAQAGIYLAQGAGATPFSALLDGNRLEANQNGLEVNAYAAALNSPEIRNNQLLDNRGWGIYFDGAQSLSEPISGNEFRGNHWPARLPASAVPSAADANVFGPNQVQALTIAGGERTEDLELSAISAPGSELHTYLLDDTLTVAEGQTLTVGAGVLIKARYAQILVGGILHVLGTTAQPVVLTSYQDDAYGGDTNEDGYLSRPIPGDWYGIAFYDPAPSGQSLIEHALIRYAANAVFTDTAGVTVRGSTLSFASGPAFYSSSAENVLEDDEVFASGNDGYYFGSGAQAIHGGRIYANAANGVTFDFAASGRVENVELFANSEAGLASVSQVDVDARGCWWGAPDGPGGEGFSGSGDEVFSEREGGVVVSDLFQGVRATGTRSNAFDAGPNLSEGTLAPPVALAGRDDSSQGTGARRSVLFDPNAVELRYPALDPSARYRLLLSYINRDDTSAAGGNVQRLVSGGPDGVTIQESVALSLYDLDTFDVVVPPTAYASGALDLRFIREKGYRAVVAEVVLVEEPAAEVDAPSAAVLAPASGTRSNATVISVSGTASDVAGGEVAQVEVGVAASGGPIDWRPATQFSVASGTWSYLWSPAGDGAYTLSARARDAAGNLGAPGAGVSLVIDTVAPAPASQLAAYDSSADAGGRIDLEWLRSADDGAGANDVAHYDVERSLSTNGPFAGVRTAPAGAVGFSDSSAANNVPYFYQVLAVDSTGNRSAALKYGPARALVNAGGDVTPPQEVTGLVATAGNGLVQLRWTLSVDTAGDLVDQLVDYSTNGGASFGAPIRLAKSVNTYVVDGLTNLVAHRFRIRVRDSASPPNTSAGVLSASVTPSVTAVRTVTGTLSTAERWPRGTYSVTGNVTVPAGGLLQIDPGAIVKFATGTGITVNGRLEAFGTPTQTIAFTAIADDSIGGDTNGNGASSGVRGAWRDIFVTQTGSASLDNAIVRYAGSGTFGNVRVDGGDLEIRHSTIRDGSASGVHAQSGTLIVEDSLIDGFNANGATLLTSSGSLNLHAIRRTAVRASVNGVQVTSVPAEITGNTITGNSGYGIFFADDPGPPELRDNTISGNGRSIRVPLSALPSDGSGNTLTGNTRDTVEVIGGVLFRDLSLGANGVPAYRVIGGDVIVYGGFRAALGPGVVWKFDPGFGVRVFGLFSALGSPPQRVVLTAGTDDGVGGDSNADGPSQARAGDWRGVTFGSTLPPGLMRMENAEVRFAGGTSAAIEIAGPSVTLQSVRVADSARLGVSVLDGSAEILDGVVERSGGDGISIEGFSNWDLSRIENCHVEGNENGISIATAAAEIAGNEIVSNRGWGVLAADSDVAVPISGNRIVGNARLASLPANAVPEPADQNVLGPNDLNALFISGGTRTADLDLGVVTGDGYELRTYVVTGNGLSIGDGSRLSIEPGVVVKFDYYRGLGIDGELHAVGTAAEPVVFTSLLDDEVGGDTNRDGVASTPHVPIWYGISFSPIAAAHQSLVDHAVFRYADTAVYADTAGVTIRNTLFSLGSTALYSFDASHLLENDQVFANGQGYLFTGSGAQQVHGGRLYGNGVGIRFSDTASGRVEAVELFANGTALASDSSGSVDARGSWWGSADGPVGDGHSGTGGRIERGGAGEILVSDLFEGFLTTGSPFSYFDAGGTERSGFGISAPIVSGEASTAWGTDAASSILFDQSAQRRITAEYQGLTAGVSHQLILGYLNRDPGGSTQTLSDGFGHELHGPFALTNVAEPFSALVPTGSVDQGSLSLVLHATSGQRAVVSSLLLVQGDATDAVPPLVALTAPVSGALLPAGTHEIRGTASDSGSGLAKVELSIEAPGAPAVWRAVTEVALEGSWRYAWSPASGSYAIQARATDRNGNRALAPAVVSVTVDAVPPAAPTELVVEPAPGGVLRSLWIRSADDGAGANDVAHYQILRRSGRTSPPSVVATLGPAIQSYDDSGVTPAVGYFYRVRALDLAGNGSDGAEVGPRVTSDVVDVTSPENVTGLSASATSVGGQQISVRLTWTASANSAGDLVAQRLYVSRTGSGSFGTNAPAFDNGQVFTLPRAATSFQIVGLQAGVSLTFRVTTIDEVPNESSGASVAITPSGAATQVITLPTTLPASTVELLGGVYRIVTGLTVPAGSVLRLQPGAIVKLDAGATILVDGRLEALGSASSPVVFTSIRDDSYGGDTNGNGASSGSAGAWPQIFFRNASSGHLEQTVVRYAGSSGSSVRTDRAALEILHGWVREGSGTGVLVTGGSADIEDSTIETHTQDGVDLRRVSTTVLGGPYALRRNTIRGAHNGIDLDFVPAVIEGNTITGNSDYGVFYQHPVFNAPQLSQNTITGNRVALAVPLSALPDETNTVGPNTERYLGVQGGNSAGAQRIPVLGKGQPGEVRTYLVCNASAGVSYGTSLSIDAGVVLKFCFGTGLSANGELHAEGTAAEPVVFTSQYDGSDGWDFTGPDSLAANGSWTGISIFDGFDQTQPSLLRHVRVSYGGTPSGAALALYGVSPRVEESEISNSAGIGVRLNGTAATVAASRIWGNQDDGIRIDSLLEAVLTFNRISTNGGDAIEVGDVDPAAQISATGNQIFGNRGAGLRVDGATSVAATGNWWGDFDGSGPFAPDNGGGTGQEVTAGAVYAPFATSAPFDVSYADFRASGVSSVGNLPAPTVLQGTFSDEWDPDGHAPDRTAVFDPDRVRLHWSGLSPAKSYRVRTSYFSADPVFPRQSLRTSGGAVMHPPVYMPGTPTQYEYAIPSSQYASGDLTLEFVHEVVPGSQRAAVTEAWMLEDTPDLAPPRLDDVKWNDRDGSHSPSPGDEYVFTFSEPMDQGTLLDGTTQANERLAVAGGRLYGAVNAIQWSADGLSVTVTLTAGVTLQGGELVTPAGLRDLQGNLAVGSRNLPVADGLAPHFAGIDWLDRDASGALSAGDGYVFRFDEAMDVSGIQSGASSDANTKLRPAGSRRYGTLPFVTWAADARSVTVDVTSGYTILGDELVEPSAFVTDAGGNSVLGTQPLTGRDVTAPVLLGIRFDDSDGSGSASAGDRYLFRFSEPMEQGFLQSNADADARLSPAGRSYGVAPPSQWDPTGTVFTLSLGAGFTVQGDELVVPSPALTDLSENPISNAAVPLTLVDDVAPTVLAAHGNAVSPVPQTADYRVEVQFSTAMKPFVNPLVSVVADGGTQPSVPATGVWSATAFPNDTYTTDGFAVDRTSLGQLHVSVSGGEDVAGNPAVPLANAYSFSVQAAPPGITSHPIAPAVTNLTTTSVAIAGTRDPGSAIWINGVQRVAVGSGAWSATLSLAQGLNDLEIHALAGGLASESVHVRFFVDSVAPQVSGSVPANGSFVNARPAILQVTVNETGSGVDFAASTLSITRGGSAVGGQWMLESGGLVFTPSAAFVDGSYSFSVRLRDAFGLLGSQFNGSFTVDTSAPPPPTLNAFPAVTAINSVTTSGTKEAFAAILRNGAVVVSNTSSTTWSVATPLTPGANDFSFVARDRALNPSTAVTASVTYDNAPPGPVPLTVQGAGNGQSAVLSWTSYDEFANGNDIAQYTVYISASPFSNAGAANALATLPKGTKTYTATGLVLGQTVYFAVVARDTAGNENLAVSSVPVTPADAAAPEEVTNLRVTSFADHLLLEWSASADSVGDLAGYRVYVDAQPPTTLAKTATSFDATSLPSATSHTLRVTAVDTTAHESAGVTRTGVTWLANPTGLAATPLGARVDLRWNAATPSALVKSYRVYMSTAPIASVAGLTPQQTVAAGKLTAGVTGLTNGTTYHFAVTAVNTSDGERPDVVSVSATPQPDTQGPTLSDATLGGTPLADGRVVTAPSTIAVNASDPSGVSRVEFSASDGASTTLIGVDVNASGGYTALWNVSAGADGSYTLTLHAFDTVGNDTTQTYSVSVVLGPPAAPAITSPATGKRTSQTSLAFSGTAAKDTQVQLHRAGAALGAPVTVSFDGKWTTTATLVDGANAVTATALNRGGESAASPAVTVTLDRSIPGAPIGLTAEARPGGEIRLNWTAANDGQRVTYDLYRSTAAFDDTSQATRINANHIGTWPFTDLPASDGKYFYRAVAVNDVGTASPASNQASAEADATAPHALSIVYQTTGPHDVATGRYAPGAIHVQVAVSEPLQTTPFLSIAPSGGVPIAIALRKVADTSYEGDFEITPFTKSGTAFAVFSARDRVGNRGTNVDAGATLSIDTTGPIVTSLTTTPSHPIRNDQASPVEVLVTLHLSERTGGGATPQLDYTLSASSPTPTPIPSIQSASGDGLTWEAIFSLPGNAGLAAAESLRFAFHASDDLGNASTEIQGANQFQVYQGDLPPADVPTGLSAVAKPGGAVELSWSPVDEAVAYQLYRKGPDAPAGEALQPLGARLTATTFGDATTQDGVYSYAVASVRSDNGQQTLSAQSAPVTAVADSSAPLPPQSLALSLTSRGILAQWAPPVGGVLANGVVTYAVYRDDTPLGQNIQIAGLTPVQGNIAGLQYLDPHPSPAEHAYVVVAIDAAGNTSVPSNTAYLNFNLLPVATLTIDQVDTGAPLVRWTYPNTSPTSYRLRLGSGADAILLQDSSGKSYSDSGYDGGERLYGVAAVDAGGAEGPTRSLLLPVLSATLADDARVERGVFTRLDYQVRNGGTTSLAGVRVKTEIHTHSAESAPFDLAAGETRTVPVVVGGFPDLAASEPVRTTIELTPNEGETVSIARTANVEVVDSGLVTTVETEDLVRGATGRVRFRLENTSAVETEIVVAETNGTKPSNEVRFLLLDADENVLSALPITQFSGTGVVSLSNHRTVARIPAGEAFTSSWFDLPVPASAPDGVSVALAVDSFHYKLGEDEHVAIPGNGGRSAAALAETSYFGELTAISPTSSFGDQDVVITGRAIDRVTHDPLPSAALNVVVRVKGFERKFAVQTVADGTFELHYTPTARESGIYAVSVLHPSRLDRPDQGEFTIGSIAAAPTHFDVRVPKNYEATLPIKLTAGDGTSARNVHVEYLAADQTGGVFPTGIAVTLPAPVDLASRDAVTLNVKLSADNHAASTGSLRFRLVSDSTGPSPIANIDASCAFSDAQPALFFSPTVLQTGVTWNGSVQESIRLENRGLAPLLGVRVALLEKLSDSPAPSWAYLTSTPQIGNLEVGQTSDVGLAAQPTNVVPEGYHEFRLHISADNYPTRDIPVVISVLQNGIGSAIFHVSDIYTATLDSNNQPIPGLAGARLKIEHEDILNITRNGFTDSLGEIQFSDLPAGRYRFRASSPDHDEVAGRFRILPGVTSAEEVFLTNALVTVEWSVEETTIQDRYEIKLTATFKTDVPVPVLVLEPTSVTLPDMRKGDVFYGEFTITNHGLIRAGEVKLQMPGPDAFIRYELLADVPDTIDAKQRVVIPYRAVAIGSLDPSLDAGGTGGGSCSYQAPVCVSHREPCANGTMFSDKKCGGFVNSGRCASGGPGTGGGATGGGGGGGSVSWSGPGGGVIGAAILPASSSVQGLKCAPGGCDKADAAP
jgi:parallel beta-helix repeat protein